MIIELQGITKYYGRLKALEGITASIQPGTIGLLGPNGAGKSTLIKALLGLVRLTAGSATVLGHDVRTASRSIRQQVGYMPEDDCAIAGLKGVELVAYAGELAGLPSRTSLRRAHEILDYVGLAEERYREVQTYSTGMKQRIKLAQALIHAPKLLFLDEPTSGLDPEGRERMLKMIRNLAEKRGISVVISTHILHDVEASCDSVLILSRGRLLVAEALRNLRRPLDNAYRVRFEGDREPFLAALKAKGCQIEPVGDDELRLTGLEDRVPDIVFRAAQDCRVTLREIAPSRTSLEEIFLGAVAEDRDADL